jgi:capsular polysaccharide biosynthesis protein
MPEVFRHRRAGGRDGEVAYLDDNTQENHDDRQKSEAPNFYSGKYIYAGPFHPHFGHALTESIHRLWAFDSDTYDGVVFAISLEGGKNTDKYSFPGWFAQILELIGVPLAKCVLVTNNCMFENLVIPEPGSELALGAKQWYRSYLNKLQEKIVALASARNINKIDKIFLGRNHIPFSGIVAGEKYFESCLVDEGYVSLKPENYDIIEQLAYFINAKKIIFSEGSAIYILELIDYLEVEIACIPRRQGNTCFQPHLDKKCSKYIVAGDVKDILNLTDWKKYGIRKPLRINQHPYKIVESLREQNFCSLKNWDWNKFLPEEKHYVATYIKRAYHFLPADSAPGYRINTMKKYLQVRGTPQTNPNSQDSSKDNPNKLSGEEKGKLFQINNAVVERFQNFRGRFEFEGGPVFPQDIPGIFCHRRADPVGKAKYLARNFQNSNSNDSKIDDSKFHSGTYIYGGFFNGHFGHVLTESVHRLWAFDPSIHDGIVFALLSASPRRVPIPTYTPPEWWSEILEILDIPLSSCIFVTDRQIFENLVIPEPGSELSLGMKQWYRPYLEKLQGKISEKTHNLRKELPKQKLFLGRNHIPFNGLVVGEKYIESQLVDEGYVSFKPESHNFLEQLAYLINAEKIIFSEGSAIYSLELINYLDAEIACIPRRATNKLFEPHLKNKCKEYIIAGNLDDCVRLGDYSSKDGGKGIFIIKRPNKIVESLRNRNFALLKEWDDNKFLNQEKRDLMEYIAEGYQLLQEKEPFHCLNIIERYLQERNTSLIMPQNNSSLKIYPNMQLTIRSDRLNKLATLNQSSNYLEIGVHRGITFQKVNVDKKVAVDPKFSLNKNEYPKEKVVFLEITSDEFFINHAKNYPAFDLIYLDGLHTFEQTFRDFCASLACAHSKTIWLIDDTCPGSYAQAQPSLQRCRQIQKISGEKDGSWMGDVFKIVAAIHDFFPQYSFATFPDHGQTVVWHKRREDFEPKWNNLETISRLEYADFVELQSSLFKKEPYEKIFERISHDLSEL